MSELDHLLLDLLEAQGFYIDSYRHLVELVEDEELREAFEENFRHLQHNHKEIIFHLKERLEGLQPDSDDEDDDEEEGD